MLRGVKGLAAIGCRPRLFYTTARIATGNRSLENTYLTLTGADDLGDIIDQGYNA
jgi:hypothetical protein